MTSSSNGFRCTVASSKMTLLMMPLEKLMEHVVLTRLSNYMEDGGLYPFTMLGGVGLKAILGLDLTKAFDNIKYKAVLGNFQDLRASQKAYTFVQDYLLNRTAQITIGEIKSDDIELGSRGMPQGLVLPRFLFNVAMIGGGEGEIEETLQQATDAVEHYTVERGFSISSQKSELLLVYPTTRKQYGGTPSINIKAAPFKGCKIKNQQQWQTLLLSSDQ
ncbi:uncharacterized protein [Dermacentor albipictus]|uniref:uncharacterized protein n=1 Tax=Dermacentor albipictus TaxID=60249 RepID=UPI0038FC31C7